MNVIFYNMRKGAFKIKPYGIYITAAVVIIGA